MVVYDSQTETATFISGRETAGSKADKNMFKGNSDIAQTGMSFLCYSKSVSFYR